MSKHYLLLGAGFSRNWDGWLVSEIFDHLLTLEAMQQRPSLVALLKRHQRDGTGFEGALSAVQEAAARSSRTADDVMNLVVFQDAITSTFRLMNSMFFEKTGIDFSNSREASVRDFLARFDAIFTLNQDLLLEKHYVDVVNPGNPGVGLPGIQRPLNLSPHDHARWLSEPWIVGDTVPGAASWKNSQPVFKLHGSSNWRRSDGKDLVIMGGQKMKAIQESPVLTWYHDEFARRLAEPGARLMTIGYGFQDQHINAPDRKSVV